MYAQNMDALPYVRNKSPLLSSLPALLTTLLAALALENILCRRNKANRPRIQASLLSTPVLCLAWPLNSTKSPALTGVLDCILVGTRLVEYAAVVNISPRPGWSYWFTCFCLVCPLFLSPLLQGHFPNKQDR